MDTPSYRQTSLQIWITKKWRIYDVFHVSLLEKNTTRKKKVDKVMSQLQFNDGNDKGKGEHTRLREFVILQFMLGSQKVIYQVSIIWFYRRATPTKKILRSLFWWCSTFENWLTPSTRTTQISQWQFPLPLIWFHQWPSLLKLLLPNKNVADQLKLSLISKPGRADLFVISTLLPAYLESFQKQFPIALKNFFQTIIFLDLFSSEQGNIFYLT